MTTPTPPEPGIEAQGFAITPLKAIERNGLRGFGFSVHFGSSSAPAQDDRPATVPSSKAQVAGRNFSETQL